MQVTIVPSSVSGQPTQLFTTYLINGTVAVDAGSLGLFGTIAEQARVKHVLITHSHLDHIASLPPFLDAVYDGSGDCVTVYGNAHVLECLRKDVFNNRVYPDFFAISTFRPPYIKVQELTAGQTIEVSDLRITPVEVTHAVPTYGFVIEDDHSAVVFPSDTAPTEEIWQVARRCANLRAVFLEATFPESMRWLAEIAKHLTPSLYADEMKKLNRPAVRFITVHMHPRFQPIVSQELMALKLPGVEIGEFAKVYTF
jgi:ribonuclease BN (tRNA processing enzyme)